MNPLHWTTDSASILGSFDVKTILANRQFLPVWGSPLSAFWQLK